MPIDISAAPASERGYDHHAAAPPPNALGSLGEPPAVHPSRRETCWLCGQVNMTYQLLPDGGDGCDDVRWYCLDTRACTERWVAAKRHSRRP
jgi:hypothetical protein